MARGFPSLATLSLSLLLGGAAGAQTLPVADAGDDQSFPCAPATGAEVTLDGSGSSDPDDPLAVLTYTWSGDAALGVGVTLDGVAPVVTLPAGVHTLTLTVDDGVDGTATDDVQITVVVDSEPPTLVLSSTTAELWPPNHKQHAFTAADYVMTASDSCDTEFGPEDVIFARGTSDEADNGQGDGNTTGDISFATGCGTALLRSERAGPGDGRVYELVLSAQDAAGNAAAEQVLTVSVPHDRAHDAVDSGDVFEVVAEECGPMELCPPAPDPACVEAGSAQVEIETGGKNGGTLRWQARDFPAAEGEFSDPATDYQLCIYTDDGGAAVLEDDPAAPHGSGWKHKKKGASFKGKKAPNAELDSVKLGEKKGEGAISISVSGDEVDLPELPIADGTALVLQLHDSQADCVGSTFTDPSVNTAERYSAEVGD